MKDINRVREAKAILANKLLWETLDELTAKAIADWKGQADKDKQHAIWHQVNAINRVRDSVRRKADDTVRNDKPTTEG